LDERRQRILLRYYFAAGAGGLAVAVHTTQFAIRDKAHGLFQPILQIACDEMDRADRGRSEPLVRIAGICGKTGQAIQEARLIRDHGYHAGLLSLGAMKDAGEWELLQHCRQVASELPVVGFYLQPSVGGRVLPFSFWQRFSEIENVVAIKIAPFNRYQTLEVVRAVVEADRDDIALYTGNDDHILMDLLTPFQFERRGKLVERSIVGGLLGQWAVGTKAAVGLLSKCHRVAATPQPVPHHWLAWSAALTDLNGALFDAANGFGGCIAGIHEVLRRQGLMDGIWCLDPNEGLGTGQKEAIDRVLRLHTTWLDEAFIREHLAEWSDSC
jgi:hypothetical protein